MIVPPGAKMPPLEQRKKRGFCKYHNFLGHKTSQCFLFRDLVQGAIQDGRLKFGEKPKAQMKIDSDPLQMVDAHYAEPTDFDGTVNMVEVTEDFTNKAVMVKFTKDLDQKFGDNFEYKIVKADNHGPEIAEDTGKGIAEGSNLQIVTKETADNFVRMDEATDGLDGELSKMVIADDVDMDINMVDITPESTIQVDEDQA